MLLNQMDTTCYLELAKRVFDIEIQHILRQKDLLDSGFSKSIDLILNAKGKIVLCGIGKSGVVAKKISVTFASIGLSTIFLHAAEASHGDLGAVRTGDIVIILSNSGSSHELINVIDYCNKTKVPIIAISSSKHSVLSEAATANILIQSNCEVMESIKVPNTSTTIMTIIGDALAVALAEAMGISAEEYKSYHPGGSIGNALLMAEDLMKSGKDLPIVHLEAKMSEVILTMNEKSLGCAIVTDEKLNVLGIVTDGDLRRHAFLELIHLTASQVMNSRPKCISKDVLIIDALKYMNYKSITSMIVSDNNKVIGLLHIHDCLRHQPSLQIVEA